MKGITPELIQLQTVCLAYNESIIDDNGEYKKTQKAFIAISNAWAKSSVKTKIRIENLIGIK